MRSNRTAVVALLAILLLFFLQVLSDFIQSIYAFGLLVTALTAHILAMLLLFTPLALVLVRRPPTRAWIIALASIAMLARLLEPMLDPGSRLVACGVSMGAFMLLFPALLAAVGPSPRGASPTGWSAAAGLLLAVLLSIAVRTVGSSLDVTTRGIYQLMAWVLAILAARLIWEMELGTRGKRGGEPRPAPKAVNTAPPEELHKKRREASLRSLQQSASRPEDVGSAVPPVTRAGAWRVLAQCIGLAAVIVMLYFAFVSPSVIARWTEAPYAAVVGTLVVAWAAFAFAATLPRFLAALTRPVVLAWNLLFVLTLVLTILPHQVAFPAEVARYPVEAAAAAPLAQIPLYAMLLLSPVIILDFMLYVRQLLAEGASLPQLGGGFALGALFILVMVFLHVFTTIYDYAAPIGPLFRDRFWLVYLLAGLALTLPVLSVEAGQRRGMPPSGPSRFPFWVAAGLAIATGAALFLTAARPSQAEMLSGGLHVMTYNIQQGFDRAGNADLAGQLGAIQRVSPDILGLQESDTARPANGNVDAVRFFGDRLGMYSYYGPTTTTGTFGIALLSKYPIQNARTFFLYSRGEQTACIQAEIKVKDRTYNVFVTHLGNDGPMVQLENVLSQVGSLPNVLLMGDFNFGPSTEQYARVTRSLRDAWLLRWPGGKEIWQSGGNDRIDDVFVSPDTDVLEADYVPDPASDHPYLYVVIGR